MGSLGRAPATTGVLVAALVAALVAGCSGNDQPTTAGAGTPTATSATPSGGGSGPAAPPASPGASAPRAEASDLATVVAEQTVKLPTKPTSSVTFGIQSLQVQGAVMVLRLVVTPQFSDVDAAASGNQINLYRALNDTGFRPTLVDTAHLKEYSPLGGGAPWASKELSTQTANNSPVLTWAYFAAPQDAITSIDVRVADFAPTFTGVPITR